MKCQHPSKLRNLTKKCDTKRHPSCEIRNPRIMAALSSPQKRSQLLLGPITQLQHGQFEFVYQKLLMDNFALFLEFRKYTKTNIPRFQKSLNKILFHYLPNYLARLHDFFTTEGDNWRVSKMKASVAVLSEARCC